MVVTACIAHVGVPSADSTLTSLAPRRRESTPHPPLRFVVHPEKVGGAADPVAERKWDDLRPTSPATRLLSLLPLDVFYVKRAAVLCLASLPGRRAHVAALRFREQ